VSNYGVYKILWWAIEVDIADIPWQKPNITQLEIN
jgi:hypothetical protein